ncbi:MAG: flagellar biosynthesis protein FliQ [Gammaproteobacteria bacterium]|nr:flagellar biosynthesis protein FliQ [Gammaproteobacteria bacterium]
MTPESVLTIVSNSLTVTTMLAAPLLLSALATGVLIGVLQAATQINEMTLTFIPKLMTLVIVLIIAGPWMLQLIMSYTINLFNQIPTMIG